MWSSSMIGALALAATFLLLVLSIGKDLDWAPGFAIFAVLAVGPALVAIALLSRRALDKTESAYMFALLVVTSILSSVFSLLLAKEISKGLLVSTFAFLVAMVTFLSICLLG